MPAELPPPREPHRILHKLGALAAAHAVRELLQAAFLILLARRQMITYGQFMLALGMGQILLLFAEFGLNQHTICRLARQSDGEAHTLWQVTWAKSFLLAIGSSAMWLFILHQNYGRPLGGIILLLAAGLGLEALTSTFFTLGQWRGMQGREALVRSLAAAAGFGYGLAALFLDLPPVALAWYKPIESLVSLAGAACLMGRPPPSGGFKVTALSATLRGSLVFALIQLTAIVYNKANLFFLQRHAGAEGVAQYSATWQIVDGVTNLVCGLLLGRILFPLFARLLKNDERAAEAMARNAARWLAPLALILVYVLVRWSDRIISLVYGPAYGPAARMQNWLAISVVLGLFHNLAAYLMMSLDRQGRLLAICATGMILNLVLCALWVPAHPLGGSVAALLATKGLVALYTVGFCHRRLGLFRVRPLLEVGAMVAAGAVVFFALGAMGLGTAAEYAAPAPLLLLVLRWRQSSRNV